MGKFSFSVTVVILITHGLRIGKIHLCFFDMWVDLRYEQDCQWMYILFLYVFFLVLPLIFVYIDFDCMSTMFIKYW
jgi:hypothetical protein